MSSANTSLRKAIDRPPSRMNMYTSYGRDCYSSLGNAPRLQLERRASMTSSHKYKQYAHYMRPVVRKEQLAQQQQQQQQRQQQQDSS